MARCLTNKESEVEGIAEVIIFDLLCWWQENHPELPISELPEWWLQNRGTRTEEEFLRLLEPVLDVMGYREGEGAATLLLTPTGQLHVEREIFQHFE